MILFSSRPTLLIVTTLNSESTEFGRFGFSFDSSFETFVEDSDVFYMVKNFPIFFFEFEKSLTNFMIFVNI